MTSALLIATALGLAGVDPAQGNDSALISRLDTLHVRAVGLEGDPDSLPVSTDMVVIERTAADSPVDTAGLFDGLPGVMARDRHNRAQDLQLSIRGYGARSTFGVRGIRILADGLPAGAPDGQSQLTQFNGLGVDAVEVVRGPFAALLGNASGGVVQLHSSPGNADAPWRVEIQGGGDGERSLGAVLQGEAAAMAWRVIPLYWRADGWRDHSQAERRSLASRWDWQRSDDGVITLHVQHFDAPDAQDPRSLTDAEWRHDPRRASPTAVSLNTRKSVRQDQLGLVANQRWGSVRGQLAAHTGARAVEQFLAIPASAQANALHGGGVVDLDSDYAGMDLRVSGQPVPQWEWTVGLNTEGQRQQRRGWENMAGGQIGVRGRMRRDQIDTVWNLDGHTQLAWRPDGRWTVHAGVRHSRIQFDSQDRYITAGNPDDSGRVAYHRSTPVAGIAFAPDAHWRWHLAAGRGMETPTFNELAYRADGQAGLALDLQPALSRQWETGLRWKNDHGMSGGLIRFHARTEDELAIAANQGGRSSYRNVGQTRREGWEASLRLPVATRASIWLAWTRLDADVTACGPAGCGGLVVGEALPGTARDQLQIGLAQQAGAWRWQTTATAVSAMSANDAGSARAPGHALVDAGLARLWSAGGSSVEISLSMDNLLDRRHVASVVVNDGNGRFYEPGAGRTVRMGLRWDFDP